MSKYRITLDGKTYEMEIERIDSRETVKTEKPVSQSVEKVQKSVSQEVKETAAAVTTRAMPATGGNAVKSPMPGTILRVNASVGDTVKKGQSILVLEAMKMENDITSPKDGKLVALYANKGDTVQGGAALFEIGE